MLVYPEITTRIQEELDSVVGRDRLPTFDDERSLPYLVAFIKEVTRRACLPHCLLRTYTHNNERWRPAVPMAVPHATSKGDVYAGYDIPAGTTVYGNIEYVVSLAGSKSINSWYVGQCTCQGPLPIRGPRDLQSRAIPQTTQPGRGQLEWQSRGRVYDAVWIWATCVSRHTYCTPIDFHFHRPVRNKCLRPPVQGGLLTAARAEFSGRSTCVLRPMALL